ncbi:hypothetical protein SR870_03360 [Rhodopseudomonas palustris]|uniref:hypothetical protein n=1 Tax=Rhodopseudomonas palustris TaxID=1076 RepID=UPI002ACDA477|nr:hypothetical protein [Rhodopseudomonas palustris]WQH00346.1 hypothetical protein SR870_03360 [Rhodopseudomonas palustris]
MSGFRRQWLWPLILAASTVFGLVAALVGEGAVWLGLSWATLSMPLLTILRCLTPSRRDDKSPSVVGRSGKWSGSEDRRW